MKKSLLFILSALLLLGFSACDDVPAPYELNVDPTQEEVVIEPAGSGTAADPFNVAMVQKVMAEGNYDDNSTVYYVKGIVSSIKEIETSQYGNAYYYISDNGTIRNQFYVYRGYGLNNSKFATGTEIQVGDTVVVCGKLVNYQGTYEFAQGNYIVSLNGSTSGGEISGEATGSGTAEDPYNSVAAIKYINSLAADVESDKDIFIKGKVVSIKEQYGTQYGNATFYISDDGTAANQFTVWRALYLGNQKYTAGELLKEGDEVVICGKVVNYRGNTPETVQGKAYLYSLNGEGGGDIPEPTPGEAKGSGTLADPYNSVAAINYIKTLGSDVESSEDIYIKGKVVSIKEQYGTQYGNATFYISDDGTAANQFTVWRALYLGNQKYTSGTLLKEGDEVVVCGKVVNFKGNTPETVQGKAYLYSLNGETGGDTPEPTPGEAKGSGTLADPYNAVAAINYIQTLGADVESSEDVYIKGKVVSVKEQYGTQYGNATFYISDDGTATNQFYVFRALYLGNQKYTAGAQIKAGDEVVVCGKVINYKGNTPETVQGKAYLYSLNGETESNGEEPGEEPGGEGVEGNSIDFTTMGYTNTQDFEGVSVKVGDATLTFSKGTGKTTPKYYTAGGGAIRLYGSNTLTITSEKEIKSVKFTYSDDYNGNSYYATAENSSVAPGSYDFSTHIWTLGAKEGVLTYTANGGHLRIVTVSIEY